MPLTDRNSVGPPAIHVTGLQEPLDVYPGELVALTGASGTGKSTILRIVAGFSPSNAIGVSFFGELRPKIKPSVGFVQQVHPVHGRLTVSQELTYAGELLTPLRGKRLSSRIDEILSVLGILPERNRIYETLSGGEKRRVDIATELLRDCQILVLDEPTSGLDPGNARELIKLLQTLAREHNIAVLFTTHHEPDWKQADDHYHLRRKWSLERASAGTSDLFPAPKAVQNKSLAQMAILTLRRVGGGLPLGKPGVVAVREAALIASDRWRLFLSLSSFLAIALVTLPWSRRVLSLVRGDVNDAMAATGLIVFACFFAGAQLTCLSIVDERKSIVREIRAGCSPGIAAAGKALFYFFVSLPAGLIVRLLLEARFAPSMSATMPEWVIQWAALSGAIFSGALAGLVISSFAKSKEIALLVMVYFVIAALMFTGIFFDGDPISGGFGSRWAYSAVTSSGPFASSACRDGNASDCNVPGRSERPPGLARDSYTDDAIARWHSIWRLDGGTSLAGLAAVSGFYLALLLISEQLRWGWPTEDRIGP